MSSLSSFMRKTMKKLLTAQVIIEKGDELNRIYADYKQAENPKDQKSKWLTFSVAAEQYRQDVAEYLRTNPADIAETL